jgi:hypothetical protein
VVLKEYYQVKISKSFAAMENLDDDDDDDDDDDGDGDGDDDDDDDDVNISRAWEIVSENLQASATESLGLYEWKECKP